jgi:hypothetical protein
MVVIGQRKPTRLAQPHDAKPAVEQAAEAVQFTAMCICMCTPHGTLLSHI